MAYKDLEKRHFPTLRKKEIISKPQPQVKPASIKSRTVQSGRTYASVTRNENNQSTTCQIQQTVQEQITLLNTSQFIEKFMQEFHNAMKKFTERTCQLVNGLATIVTGRMQ